MHSLQVIVNGKKEESSSGFVQFVQVMETRLFEKDPFLKALSAAVGLPSAEGEPNAALKKEIDALIKESGIR